MALKPIPVKRKLFTLYKKLTGLEEALRAMQGAGKTNLAAAQRLDNEITALKKEIKRLQDDITPGLE